MMTTLALNGGGAGGPHRPRPSITLGRAAAAGGLMLVAFMIWSFFNAQTVSKRPNEVKTTQVILPPPPPPPPPEIKPQEKPPEPTDAPPMEEPVDTPPPPDQPQQSSEPAPGDNALTAREGAGPSNYGLAAGNGSGSRIGGRPGGSGDAFRAYASVVQRCFQRAIQSDRELSRGRYALQLAVSFDSDGRVSRVGLQNGGDDRRNARVRTVLTGLQCSPPPPAGLPSIKLEVNTRAGG